MNQTEIITLIVSGSIGLILLFFRESFKNLISRFFTNLNRKQINLVFLSFFGLFILVIAFLFSEVPDYNQPTTPPEDQTAFEKTIEDAKEAIEVTKEATELIGTITKQARERRDSLKSAKPPRLALQIDNIKKSRKSIKLAYEELSEILPNLSIFKNSGDFYLIVDFNGNESKLINYIEDNASSFNTLNLFKDTINLVNFCRVRQDIKSAKRNIKINGVEIQTLECD